MKEKQRIDYILYMNRGQKRYLQYHMNRTQNLYQCACKNLLNECKQRKSVRSESEICGLLKEIDRGYLLKIEDQEKHLMIKRLQYYQQNCRMGKPVQRVSFCMVTSARLIWHDIALYPFLRRQR